MLILGLYMHMKRIFLLLVLILVCLGLQASERKDSAKYTPYVSLLVNGQLGSYHAQFQGQFAREMKLRANPVLSAALEYSGENGAFWKVQYTLNRYYRFWEQSNCLTMFHDGVISDHPYRYQSQFGIYRGKTMFSKSKIWHMKLYGGVGGWFILNSELPIYFDDVFADVGDEVEIDETKGILSQDGNIRKITPYISLQASKEFKLVGDVNAFIGYQINYTPINMVEKSQWLQVGTEKEYWSREQYKPNQWGLMFGVRGHLFYLPKSD